MGNSVILYGYILTPNAFERENAVAVHALPREDPYPPLTYDMFAVPGIERGYNELLITFGLVYKNLFPWYTDWERWCAKFEALLRTLHWDEARVRLDIESYGPYRCLWRAIPPSSRGDRYSGPVTTWTREGPEPGLA